MPLKERRLMMRAEGTGRRAKERVGLSVEAGGSRRQPSRVSCPVLVTRFKGTVHLAYAMRKLNGW